MPTPSDTQGTQNMKTITKKTWRSWKIIADCSQVSPVIREDAFGTRWAWVSSGKRVDVKEVEP